MFVCLFIIFCKKNTKKNTRTQLFDMLSLYVQPLNWNELIIDREILSMFRFLLENKNESRSFICSVVSKLDLISLGKGTNISKQTTKQTFQTNKQSKLFKQTKHTHTHTHTHTY
jgi:hypothetical protein